MGPGYLRSVLPWLILAPTAFLVGAGTAALDPRVSGLGLALLGALLLTRRSALALMFVAVCSLGLVRRVVADGRVDYDPLLLVPIALLALALVGRTGRQGQELDHRRSVSDGLGVALVLLILLPLAAWAYWERTPDALYRAGLYTVSFAAILLAGTGRLPDVRRQVARFAALATLVLGGYGLIQFALLPSWDRQWMLASELTTIGAPEPGQVRVFGSLESPAPFALVVSALVLVVLHRAVTVRVRVIDLAALAVGVAAIFASGVRSALVGLVIVVALALIKVRRVRLLALLAVAGGVFYYAASRIFATADPDSRVFSRSRYSIAELSQDESVNARIGLLDQIRPGLDHILGSGFGQQAADNLYVDLLLAAGPIAAGLAVLVGLLVLARALRADWTDADGAFAMVAVFTVVLTMALATFATTSGLLVAVVWGWALARPRVSPLGGPVAAERPAATV